MRHQSSTRLSIAVVATLAASCAWDHRSPARDPHPFPLDVFYRAQNMSISIVIDTDRTVHYSPGLTNEWGKASQASVNELRAFLGSAPFRHFLREARATSREAQFESDLTLRFYSLGGGIACGKDERGNWHTYRIRKYPPYVVSLDSGRISEFTGRLIQLINEVGRSAFTEDFIAIETGTSNSEPNSRVNAPVRPVTALAQDASAAPGRPARYAAR